MPRDAKPRKSTSTVSLPQAVADAGVVLFHYEARTGKVAFKGDTARFGLGASARPLTLVQLSTRFRDEDQPLVTQLGAVQAPGAPLTLRLVSKGGAAGLWRGARLADASSCAGVILATPPAVQERDRLTGLLTRNAFLGALSARLDDGAPLSVAVGDLARVRRLNEALGYAVTDKVLTALGARLIDAFGVLALPARVGDNTFAVVLAPQDGEAAVRMREVLERPMTIDGLTLHPTLAVAGAQALPGAPPGAEDLLRRAEAALGAVKSASRARAFTAASAADSDSLSRLTLEDDLRGAVERGEIEPFYQPIVRLEDSRLAGFEALVRWRHPRRGLLPPDDFLPLVSETGLMAQFGLLMARAAARQVREWRALRVTTDKLFVSVNLTTGDLERPTLVQEVADIIDGEALPPDALKLEITESEIMRDPERAAVLLAELRKAGARLSLDDFGMGYSSLSWLARLPIDGLKIDRYFIRTMGANEGSAKIVRSVVALAQDFGLEVVAEGVENAQMAASLKAVGCHYGQGFGYAPPMAAEEALVYLIERGLEGVRMQEPARV